MDFVYTGTSARLQHLCAVVLLVLAAIQAFPVTGRAQTNQPGSVQLAALPASSYLTGQTITLTATASDPNGVAKVSFYYGSTLIGEQPGSPYSLHWNTSGLAAASYSLTARLVDNLGNVTNSAARSVQLSAPAANRVTFYRAINLDGSQVVLDNYQWSGSGPGIYTTNGNGLTNNSVALSPATDEVRTAMIRSYISRNNGLALNIPIPQADNGTYQVYLYVWENDSPETFSILLEGQVVESNYNSGPAGTWKRLGPYQATIADNSIDLTTTGGTANFSGVELWRVPAVNQAANVALTSPTANQVITTGPTFTLSANATDNDGVARVEFYLGTNKIGEDATTPYSINWNSTGLPGGPYQLSARVVDNAGGITATAPALVHLVDGTVSWLFSRGINLNGGPVTIENNLWEGGSAANTTVAAGTTPFNNATAVLTPQPDAATATMLRDGIGHGSNLQLSLNQVANGTYLVYLYAFSEGDPTTFSLSLEGQTVLHNYTTGAAGWWARLGPFQVTVNDQTIDLAHTGGTLLLSGVELRQPTGLSNQPPTVGLHAYWPFNSAATMGNDDSGKGYTGTLNNAPSWVAGGRVGGSMEMADNTGRHMRVAGLNWQPTKFTIAWWLYPESYNLNNQMLLSAIGWGGFVFYTTPDGGVHVGTDVATRFTPTQLPNYTVKLYQWQHFAFTFDNGTAKFYRNGVLLASKTGMTNPVAWGGLLIGHSDPAAAIHGMVDEVRVYDRALQDAEVSRTANFYTALSCTWKPDATTNEWNRADNWGNGKVPTSNDDVTVNGNTTAPTTAKYPVLPGNARINNLTLNTGAELDLQGHTLTVSTTANLYYATIRSNGGTLRATTAIPSGCSFNGPTAAGTPAATTAAFTLHHTGLQGRYGWGGANKFYGPTTLISGVLVPQNHPGAAVLGDIYYPNGGSEFFADVTINNYGFGLVMGGGLNTFHKKLDCNYISNGGWGVRLGDGLYKGEVKITNGSGGGFHITTGNVFKQKVSLINPTSPINYGTYGNTITVSELSNYSNRFEGPVEVTNTSARRHWYSSVDIAFGKNGGTSTFTPTASLVVGSGGFLRGSLLLNNCTFQTTAATALTLTAGTGGFEQQDVTNLVISGGTYFTGPLMVTAPRILLNGGTFGGEASFTKTGTCYDPTKPCPDSIGGNTFRRKATFKNQAGAANPFNLATQKDDIVQQ